MRPDENEDMMGNKGQFVLNDNFQLVILVSYTTQEQLDKVCSLIPNHEKFKKLLVVETVLEEQLLPQGDSQEAGKYSNMDFYAQQEILDERAKAKELAKQLYSD